MTTLLYPHAPRPPFEQLGGPLRPQSISRSYGLSEDGSASAVISLNDVDDLAWILPGSCWRIDQSDLGEPVWAGFMPQEDLPMDADTFTLALQGPKEALLSIEMAIDLPLRASPPFAARQAIVSAQSRRPGMLSGSIDRGGTAVEIQARAETVSKFIDSLRSFDPTYDWRERIEFRDRYLSFYLDFGILQNPTTHVIVRDHIVAGRFTRTRPVGSLTVLGASDRFRKRSRATVAVAGMVPALSEDPTRTILRPRVDVLAARNIGPAASRHISEVQERVTSDVPGFAAARYEELLREVDTLLLTLDGTKAGGQTPQLGDIVRVSVPDWVPGLQVDATVQIRHIAPRDEVGDRDMVAKVLQ